MYRNRVGIGGSACIAAIAIGCAVANQPAFIGRNRRNRMIDAGGGDAVGMGGIALAE